MWHFFWFELDSAIQKIQSDMNSIVIMGVAGCGKSSVGARVAQAMAWPLVEGDDHHSEANRHKMQSGIALTDADRQGWLATLATQITLQPQGVVVTCSALKRSYRERLRQASPGLRFAFLQISQTEAQARVTARAAQHFFNTALVDNQFATLESPEGEAGVLTLDATRSLDALQADICTWLLPAKELA
jgi:gluconokinase